MSMDCELASCWWQSILDVEKSFPHSLHGVVSQDLFKCFFMWRSSHRSFLNIFPQTSQKGTFLERSFLYSSETSLILTFVLDPVVEFSFLITALSRFCFWSTFASLLASTGRDSSKDSSSSTSLARFSGGKDPDLFQGLSRECISKSSGDMGRGEGERQAER